MRDLAKIEIVCNPNVPTNSIYLMPSLPESVKRELESLEDWIKRCCGVIHNIGPEREG